MITAALDEYLTAPFDSSGRAVIVANPQRAREYWRVTRYQCHTNSTTGTKLTVYLGSELAGSRRDFTNSGNDDISELIQPLEIPPSGYPLRFVWTGGTPGAIAEISIGGTKEVR